MNHKLLIVKLNFKPELKRHQVLSILLSKDHLLPTAKSLTKFHEIFNNQLKLGKIFFETPDTKYYFAIITPNQIPRKLFLHKIFKPFRKLHPRLQNHS
jgi:hypothetical protein